MSYKIYNAYQISIAEYENFLNVAKKKACEYLSKVWNSLDFKKEFIEDFAKKVYDSPIADKITSFEEFKSSSLDLIKTLAKIDLLLEASYSDLNSIFCVDADLSIYIDKELMYIIPGGSLKNCKFKEFKEYRYFNNSDKPSQISTKEWNNRKEIWDKVLNTNLLKCDILNFHSNEDKNLLNTFLKNKVKKHYYNVMYWIIINNDKNIRKRI